MDRPLDRKTEISLPQAEQAATSTSMLFQKQLLSTKFFMPVTPHKLISRPRLSTLLDKSFKYPFTLVSAPAGFGKTTLLSAWAQSLPARKLLVAWVSLDEEDNDPRLFWSYVLSALDRQQPQRFTPLLTQLYSPQGPPLKPLLTTLINLLVESKEHFVLILDDYQMIIQEHVHTTLLYLVEHLPPQLRVILSTRADPPLPLPLQRARQQILEVRTEQLRCTVEETGAFFKEVIGMQFPDETIEQVTTRTEGWLVGLQLLMLSLPERADPVMLLKETSGKQRHILDYLTEVVLRQQPSEVQTFLLYTSILEQLTAPLCDAVMQQTGSQRMLEWLERANLFVVSLDSKQQWYRYHALFAQALRSRLEQIHGELVLTLHHRASLWYAKHDFHAKAILHAFSAHQWDLAADLIEQKSRQMAAFAWGVSEYELILFRQWIEQLPTEILGSRPRISLACTYLLWQFAPLTLLEAWLKAAEATLTALLTTQVQEDVSRPMLDPIPPQEQQDLLGDVVAMRAFLWSFDENKEAILPLCQQALSLLSEHNYFSRLLIIWAQLYVYYYFTNETEAAIRSALQAISLAQMSGRDGHILTALGTTARYMVGAGWLREAQQPIQQATQLGTKLEGLVLPEVGWSILSQAEIMREWNQLDAAHTLIEKAIPLCKQSEMLPSLIHILSGYAVLLRISLSCGELEAARSALQEFERIAGSMNQSSYLHMRSFFITIDRVRLWLACGELDRATRWAEGLDLGKRYGTPFAREREEVARVRILLAKSQPDIALQRLEPVLERAMAGKRWGHVIEMRLLQALAHQMCQQQIQALDALSQAVRLGEPEGYIRSFVDEGVPIETLLYQLRNRDRDGGPTPYLDTLIAAFQQERIARVPAVEFTKAQLLPEPLSKRELQVLQLLAWGASNLEIAQELVIAIDTVKRHVSTIFSKLGVKNRVQAVRQAQELGLLDQEFRILHC